MTALDLLYLFLTPPLCASVAGAVVWASNRTQLLEDSSLIRQFLLILTICLGLAWGINRTDMARMRLDPQFRLQAQLDAHPVYAAMKHRQSDHQELHNFLIVQVAQGKTLDEAFVQARELLTDRALHQLAFTEQKISLSWGRISIDTLKELQAQDPVLCYQALPTVSFLHHPLKQPFSAANTQAFHKALIELYESPYLSMNQAFSSGAQAVNPDDRVNESRAINEAVAQLYGQPMVRLLGPARDFSGAPDEPADKVCRAMLFKLEAMQARPPAMAASLLQNTLFRQ